MKPNNNGIFSLLWSSWRFQPHCWFKTRHKQMIPAGSGCSRLIGSETPERSMERPRSAAIYLAALWMDPSNQSLEVKCAAVRSVWCFFYAVEPKRPQTCWRRMNCGWTGLTCERIWWPQIGSSHLTNQFYF